jgi:hypothetical protein
MNQLLEHPYEMGRKAGVIYIKDPGDNLQACYLTFVRPGHEGMGKCIKLTHSIHSIENPNPSQDGFWLELNETNLAGATKLVFWLRGDAQTGIPCSFWMEFKSANGSFSRYVPSISGAWMPVEIPLTDFEKHTGLSEISELTILFEDTKATIEKCGLCIDEICFAK